MAKQTESLVQRAAETALKAVLQAMEKKSEGDIRLAFELPAKEAPLWAVAAMRLSEVEVKAHAMNAVGTVNNTLNLVITGREQSTEKWLERTAEFKEVAAKHRREALLPAAVAPKEEAKK